MEIQPSQFTNSSTAPEIAIALLEIRYANTKNKNTVKILNKIINEVNLTDKEIDEILIENNENNKVFTEKILKIIEKYKDDTTSTIARIIGKHCNRESIQNVKKRREIRRKITLNLLKKENILSKTKNEQRICLILDNYSVHKSAFIKEIALYLNITLIYILPYSPHLNPIEQIWRQMKREIKRYYLESKEFLKELTIKTYNKSILGTKVYDKWFETFIPKVW
ncbi:transposase [Methanobrevibacter gottschalkii]|uniref:transposase n=1 Tax=Methanobrevibacter gottschalkii TaxID=190974 RepID=UPI0038D1064F